MVSEISEFKGRKVLTLKKSIEEKWGFTFGKSKAKMIIEHIKDIEDFVNMEE